MDSWDSMIAGMGDPLGRAFPSNREAEKTNNYDRYNNEYISSQRLIMQKKETIKLVLKQDRFKTLKIKLEKMKKDI